MMARAYNTSIGTVIVENMLDDAHNEVLYSGYLLDANGDAIEHSQRTISRHVKGSEDELRTLRRYCVKCVVSCYKLFLEQQEASACKKRRRVTFNDVIDIKHYVKDTKVSRADKLREWIEFGEDLKKRGLCSPDTPEDLLNDALMCKMRR